MLRHESSAARCPIASEMNDLLMDEFDGIKQGGTFTVSPNRNIYGELTYAGPKTSLYLRDDEDFDTQAIHGQCLRGTLHDLTKVTLLHCITSPRTGHASRGKERYHFARVFPHFVLHDDRQITHDEKVITEVHFLVKEAPPMRAASRR